MTKKVEVPRAREQKMQEYLLQYQILKSSVEQHLQKSQHVSQKILELEITKQAIKDVTEAKKEQGVLIPLGNGCFSEGKNAGTKKFMIDIGAGIYVYRNAEGSKDYLENKAKELDKINKKIQDEVNNAVEKINEIAPVLQKMIENNK